MAIEANERGICPHCKTPNRFERATVYTGATFTDINITNGLEDNNRVLRLVRCTNCAENIIFFGDVMMHPKGSTRPPCPNEVPKDIAEDYGEASLVEHLSSKASAALARRCLQAMLREQGIIVPSKNLSDEIEEAMKTLPSHLSKAIDSIRNIGNFATHPIKSTDTGRIVEVVPGETAWTIDTLEQLFDFYYVQPEITKVKRAALNSKLESASKPKLK